MLSPGQRHFMSQQCSTGSDEAEQLFQLAGDYHSGRKGIAVDHGKAERLYKEAIEMGNAKAAINLGGLYLYRHDYGTQERLNDEKLTLELYQKAVEMGCPEGLYSTAAMYSRGWGVSKDQKKAKELIKLAAEQGALNAMIEHGGFLFDEGKEQEGIAWLEKSLALGNGDAAAELSMVYELQEDIEKAIFLLREGSKLGSINSIVGLISIYNGGRYGQEKDREYALGLAKLMEQIDTQEQPKSIPNFDELFPPKPVLPFK